MSPDETLKVCRLAKAISPAQSVDEYMPEAWHLILKRWRIEDAMLALEQLGGEQEWIHVSHIVARIRRIRRDRIDDFGPLPQPPSDMDPDDVAAMSRWLENTNREIADGTRLPDQDRGPEALPARETIRELGMAGMSVMGALSDNAARVRAAHAEARKLLQAAPEPEPTPVFACEAAVDDDGRTVMCERPATATTLDPETRRRYPACDDHAMPTTAPPTPKPHEETL